MGIARFLKEFWIIFVVVLLSFIFFVRLSSGPLFEDPLSTVIYDRDGDLIGARIASDGQWRFPATDSLPEKYKEALLLFEDKYFYYHPGINPASLLRAVKENISAGEVVSGGSTITMQLMRMSRKNRPRTLGQKIIESLMALSYELRFSKGEILLEYANNAPFGGNVVGIEAATWRYFGTSPSELTWSEAALLAVLPNAPSLIHPGRNREVLKSKRNSLLEELCEAGKMDELSCQLAREEPLPDNPLPLPNLAPHLSDRIMMGGKQKRFRSTLDQSLQERVNEIAGIRQEMLRANQIHNMACLVMDVRSGEVLAYMGNTKSEEGHDHGSDVDIITSQRSTGSILKPFLFAGMIDNGSLLQSSLIPDVPIRYNGYAPKNYDREYEGAVPAARVLSRSLNIPSVILLRRYGVDPFLNLLKKLGFNSFRESHEHYGLTLILGGRRNLTVGTGRGLW